MPQIQTGVIVSVRDIGGTYCHYEDAAKELNLKYWKEGKSPVKDGLYKVVGKMIHKNGTETILGIESVHDKKKQFLIEKEYVEYVRESDNQFVFNF